MQLKQENFPNVSCKLNLNSRGSFLKGLASKIHSIAANSIHDDYKSELLIVCIT